MTRPRITEAGRVQSTVANSTGTLTWTAADFPVNGNCVGIIVGLSGLQISTSVSRIRVRAPDLRVDLSLESSRALHNRAFKRTIADTARSIFLPFYPEPAWLTYQAGIREPFTSLEIDYQSNVTSVNYRVALVNVDGALKYNISLLEVGQNFSSGASQAVNTGQISGLVRSFIFQPANFTTIRIRDQFGESIVADATMLDGAANAQYYAAGNSIGVNLDVDGDMGGLLVPPFAIRVDTSAADSNPWAFEIINA